MPSLDGRAEYSITVHGRLDGCLADRVGPAQIECRAEGDETATLLAGIVTDQAGLLGLIRYLHGLGIVLLAVQRRERE